MRVLFQIAYNVVLTFTEIVVVFGDLPYLPVVAFLFVSHPSNPQPLLVGSVVLTVNVTFDFANAFAVPVVAVALRYCVPVCGVGAPEPPLASYESVSVPE